LWLQGHTARASLLCSVGKIFHCVHYLSAAPRMKHKMPPIIFIHTSNHWVYTPFAKVVINN